MFYVVVDDFTKFVRLFPMQQAKLTVDVLHNHLFSVLGRPVNLAIDNGTQFLLPTYLEGCVCVDVLCGQRILHVTTPPCYPKPSHAERVLLI